MKSTKPLTDQELETWEDNRDLETELLESVRQMIARKGRIVMSPDISLKKKVTDENSTA
jgi:putative transcriptional regulator